MPDRDCRIGVVLHGPEIIDSGCALKLVGHLQRLGRVKAVLGGTMGRVALMDAALQDAVQIGNGFGVGRADRHPVQRKSDRDRLRHPGPGDMALSHDPAQVGDGRAKQHAGQAHRPGDGLFCVRAQTESMHSLSNHLFGAKSNLECGDKSRAVRGARHRFPSAFRPVRAKAASRGIPLAAALQIRSPEARLNPDPSCDIRS